MITVDTMIWLLYRWWWWWYLRWWLCDDGGDDTTSPLPHPPPRTPTTINSTHHHTNIATTPPTTTATALILWSVGMDRCVGWKTAVWCCAAGPDSAYFLLGILRTMRTWRWGEREVGRVAGVEVGKHYKHHHHPQHNLYHHNLYHYQHHHNHHHLYHNHHHLYHNHHHLYHHYHHHHQHHHDIFSDPYSQNNTRLARGRSCTLMGVTRLKNCNGSISLILCIKQKRSFHTLWDTPSSSDTAVPERCAVTKDL